MWTHNCPSSGLISVAHGEACSWCDAEESLSDEGRKDYQQRHAQRLFSVSIGQRGQVPRLMFEAMGTDSVSIFNQHVGLAHEYERMEVRPV